MFQSSPELKFSSRPPDGLMVRSSPDAGTEAPARYRLPMADVVHGGNDHVECPGESCCSCTALAIGDCVALGCCPFAVVNVLALTLVKLPWVASRRCLASLRRRRASMRRRRVADVGGAEEKMREAAMVRAAGRSSGEWREDEGGTPPGLMETEDGVWLELYQVGNWGFGRVSFSGIQREWCLRPRSGGGGGSAPAATFGTVEEFN
ncbi:uncharacterized protein LOC122029933 isoform X1 [Zingiber officinale]|uniref:uncharacterized protein LOC122029933 isoform X1 n=2 Tax=Zingiber officinale TaxID=94328 RepID=UPI001C4C5FD5|nr:uncharacterized protein LOC122029933 isoform X1 [Zingiber officinale]